MSVRSQHGQRADDDQALPAARPVGLPDGREIAGLELVGDLSYAYTYISPW